MRPDADAADAETDDDAARRSTSRLPSPSFRFELLVGVLALVASAIASVATLIQTRTNGVQLSASVWPYLTISDRFDAPRFQLGFDNQGLGPALVRTFTLSIDGRSKRRWGDAIAALDPQHRYRVVMERDFGGGTVLRPGEDVTLASIVGAPKTSQACYCSLLENCWSLESQRIEPQPLPSCGRDTPNVT